MDYDPFKGVRPLGNDRSLADLWIALHNSANCWPRLGGQNRAVNKKAYDNRDKERLQDLAGISSGCWVDLCCSIGMTVYGAVALSWCKDAEINDVWESWEASGFPLKPLPEFERPARLINPAFMPKTRSLKGIVDEMGNSSIAICAAIASNPETLEFDLDSETMKSAKPQLASFLKSRTLEKQDRTAEEEAFLRVWSDAVKDTEWDVWSKEVK